MQAVTKRMIKVKSVLSIDKARGKNICFITDELFFKRLLFRCFENG